MDNNDDDWCWKNKFKRHFFWNEKTSFKPFFRPFSKTGVQKMVNKFINWCMEFTTDFIFPEIEETENELIVIFNTPGISKKDLEIKTDRKTITIIIKKDGRAKKRSIDLPKEIIPSKSYSTYKDGQLKIHLPKLNKDEPISID